jgi:hypothetical protein
MTAPPLRQRPGGLFLLLAVLLLTVCLVACTEKQQKDIKHLKSDLIGLKRTVTLYDCNGEILKVWEGRFKIEVQGAYLSFIDERGKDIKVSGTVVVEEL